jgi:hypothetical protein
VTPEQILSGRAVITIMGVGIVFSPIILISRLKRESGLIVLFCLLSLRCDADDGRDGISGEVAAVPSHRLVLER